MRISLGVFLFIWRALAFSGIVACSCCLYSTMEDWLFAFFPFFFTTTHSKEKCIRRGCLVLLLF